MVPHGCPAPGASDISRFERRLRGRLRHEEFAAGYRKMAAELALLHAPHDAREPGGNQGAARYETPVAPRREGQVGL